MSDTSGVATDTPGVDEPGVRRYNLGSIEWGSRPHGPGYLAEHRAVKAHGDGISGVDFSSFIESFADYARGRAEGIGQRQYFDGAKQRFEFYSAKDLIDETLDELADVVNYSAMLAVKLLALKAKVT